MISQPGIVVLGLSQPCVFIECCLQILVVAVLGFELYLRFKLWFKPSVELYLRTSTRTRIAILVFFNHYCFSSHLFPSSAQRALSVSDNCKESQVSSYLVPISRSVLVLNKPSDVAI